MALKIYSVSHLVDMLQAEPIAFRETVTLATNAQMTAGTGITTGTGTIYKASVITKGNIIYTDILMDITGLTSAGTLGDIIGKDATANCHLGQITAAINGTILGGTMTCLETPDGGEEDIDIYSATVATGTENAAIGDLTETAVLNTGADWTAGTIKAFADVPDNGYLYFTVGTSSSPTAGDYTAGRFLIQMWGYAA